MVFGIFLAIITIPTAIAVWLTERIDRVRRRQMRLDAQNLR